MKIQNKLLLLAFAAVVMPTVVSARYMSKMEINAENQASLETRISGEIASSQAKLQRLEATAQQLKDYEKTTEFRKLQGRSVSAFRKHRASIEQAVTNLEHYITNLQNNEKRLESLNDKHDQLMNNRQKQAQDDMNNIIEKKAKKDDAMMMEDDNVPSYNVEGKKLVGGQAGL
ncbi:MAG: hypothetical protein WC747_01285 [Candidatus Babeliales bacterium]|jgi:myosin heavy subunit